MCLGIYREQSVMDSDTPPMIQLDYMAIQTQIGQAVLWIERVPVDVASVLAPL